MNVAACEQGQNDFTSGNLLSNLWAMTWPLLLTMLSLSVIDLVHVHVAEAGGAVCQAAVGLGDQVMMIAILVATSLGNGAAAVVAKKFGAGQTQDTIAAAASALNVAASAGLGLAALLSAGSCLDLTAICGDKAVATTASSYLGLMSWYLVPFTTVSAVNAIFRAAGNSRLQLQVICLMTATDVLLNMLLGGNGNLQSVAASALIAASLGAVFALVSLRKSSFAAVFAKGASKGGDDARQILQIGLGSAALELARITSTFVLFFILGQSHESAAGMAAWTLGMRLESFVFMPLDALAMGAAAIIGQNIGAGNIQRAWSAGWMTAGIGVLLMSIAGFALAFFAQDLAALLSHDSNVLQLTADYLRANGIAEPFLALEVILGSALQTTGNVRQPMLIGLASNWMLRLPLAAALALTAGQGAEGVWMAMAVSNLLAGVLMAYSYAKNDVWTTMPSSLDASSAAI